MTFEELLSAARYDLRDSCGTVDLDHSLSTAAGYRYFNDALNEACRRSRLLIDRTTAAICTYTVTANNPVITIDSRIIKIRRAHLSSSPSTYLIRKYTTDMDEIMPGWETHTGTTDSYVADFASSQIYLYRKPSANDTLNLVVQRYPLAPLAQLDDEPEIADQYHEALVHYVVAKIRSIEDSELYNPVKAAKAMEEFEKEFGKKRSALDERWEESQPFAEYE